MFKFDKYSLELFLIKSLGGAHTTKTINSFKNTSENFLPYPNIIEEKSSREKTLNEILLKRNSKKDLFIFVDDIEFRGEWLIKLRKNYDKGSIIGFSMLNPNGNTVQDYGYDFASFDGEIGYKGLFKNKPLKNIFRSEFRECSSVCGCAMIIKKEVFDYVDHFPFGYNRWSEILFCHQAKKYGFKTIVISSDLIHLSNSTKNKDNADLSSISWTIEKKLWEITKKEHKLNEEICIKEELVFKRILDIKLINKLTKSKKVLLYGCGSICQFILKNNIKFKHEITSSLKEEINTIFCGMKVIDIKNIDFNDFDIILITPIGYNDEILKKFDTVIKDKIYWVTSKEIQNKTIYSICGFNN